jgi:hypothetical protein
VSLINHGNGIVMLIAQVGPTELFLPDGTGVQNDGGIGWLMWGVVLVVMIVVGVWIRAMGQRRVDPRELAFRALSRRLGLSHKQVTAIRAMGASSGQSPVGLLMSPSAVRVAAK